MVLPLLKVIIGFLLPLVAGEVLVEAPVFFYLSLKSIVLVFQTGEISPVPSPPSGGLEMFLFPPCLVFLSMADKTFGCDFFFFRRGIQGSDDLPSLFSFLLPTNPFFSI